MSALNAIPYDTNVSNFLSVKLSGKQNYFLWKAQILCLLNSVNMCGILDNAFVRPRDSGPEILRQYDNLVRGWIFGSVSEDVLAEIYNLNSAKAVWKNLQSLYDPLKSLEEDSTSEEENTSEIEVVIDQMEDTQSSRNRKLTSLIIKGNWQELESMLVEDRQLATVSIDSDGSTILHIVVKSGQNDLLKNLLSHIDYENVLVQRDSDGSTALHIAASMGNKRAAELLVSKNFRLLLIKDWNGEDPLHKAYANMHFDIIATMMKVMNEHIYPDFDGHDNKTEVQSFLVNAISAKRYSLALEFLKRFPDAASGSDTVLLALAKTFPSGLDDREQLIYPSLKNALEMLRKTSLVGVYLSAFPAIMLYRVVTEYRDFNEIHSKLLALVMVVIATVPSMLGSAFAFVCLLILIVCFPFPLLYYLWWKGAKILAFPPIKNIENKVKEHGEAKRILVWICDEIDKNSDTYHSFYARPIIQAACQNDHIVVGEILSRSPEAIRSLDESGCDIMQLAIINRSEKIFNLLYDIGERKKLNKMHIDSSRNNILHLVGRLAPSSALNRRRGAALQLQRELQWLEEVKKLVIPTYIVQENIFKETPDMLFTIEHKELVKEGEQWMKTTSESFSIAAALITTIVFAAAITVPGGSNQEKGTPLFRKEIAFIIFAISDAISLFAATTALLVFLSILTARFSEKDFIFSLPSRLFIGVFSLLLSTIAMMVAFSATLFLVFCDKKLWMLAPICVLAFIPIACFAGLQFPLMVDLFNSTFLPIFGNERKVTLKSLISRTYEYTLDFADIGT